MRHGACAAPHVPARGPLSALGGSRPGGTSRPARRPPRVLNEVVCLKGRERAQARAHPSGGGKHCSAEDDDDELGLAAGPGFFKHLFEGSACRLVTDIERGSCRTQRFAGDEPKGKARFRRRQAVLNLQWRDVPIEYHSSTCRSRNGTQPAAMKGKPYNLVSADINSLLIPLPAGCSRQGSHQPDAAMIASRLA
jgi:hypothetical protein